MALAANVLMRETTPVPLISGRDTVPIAMSPDAGTPVRPYTKESDAIQRFFNRPLFLSLTIGIPFCVYKFLFGITLIRFGAGLPFPADLAGWIVTAWSLADLGMNVGRQVYDIRHRPAPFEYCTIAQIGRFFSMPMVFLAVDTFL